MRSLGLFYPIFDLSANPSRQFTHNADKILDQIFFAVFSNIDHFDPAILHREQSLDVVEPEPRQTVFVFNDDEMLGSVSSLSNLGRVSFTPEPISFTTCATQYPLAAQ